MLPAIETPAEKGAAIIDRASRRAQIHALTVRIGGKQEHRIPSRLIPRDAMPVRLYFVALFWVKKEALIASTALRAPIAGRVGLSVGEQTPV